MAGGIFQKDIHVLGPKFIQEVDKNVFCPYCQEAGFYERLGKRILKPNEPVPEDYENWLQCTACGRVSPKYILKYESELEDVVDVVENPFDVDNVVVSNENLKKLSPRQKEIKKLIDRIIKEKDEDIKRELMKGNTVEIIQEDGTEQAYLS